MLPLSREAGGNWRPLNILRWSNTANFRTENIPIGKLNSGQITPLKGEKSFLGAIC